MMPAPATGSRKGDPVLCMKFNTAYIIPKGGSWIQVVLFVGNCPPDKSALALLSAGVQREKHQLSATIPGQTGDENVRLLPETDHGFG